MDPHHAGALLVGGAGGIDACLRIWLASSVLPAWGEPSPPRLAPWGNGKGGPNSWLPQANFDGELSSRPQVVWIVALGTRRCLFPSSGSHSSSGSNRAPV